MTKLTRTQMLDAYIAKCPLDYAEEAAELTTNVICQAIFDGILDYDPVADTLSITDLGIKEAEKSGHKIARIH